MALFKRSAQKEYLEFEELVFTLQRKNIKNIHLRIKPSDGALVITCPMRTSQRCLHLFIQTNLKWIRQKQKNLLDSVRCTPEGYHAGSLHYVDGKAHILQFFDDQPVSGIKSTPPVLQLQTSKPFCAQTNQKLLEQWYRHRLSEQIPPLITKWEPKIKRNVCEWRIKKMKTRWGTCNPAAQRIWLNLELAKTPHECLEYVLVHEMVHLLERSHNATFHAYMDTFLPDWRQRKMLLSRFIIG